jgi:hypothetical protein
VIAYLERYAFEDTGAPIAVGAAARRRTFDGRGHRRAWRSWSTTRQEGLNNLGAFSDDRK